MHIHQDFHILVDLNFVAENAIVIPILASAKAEKHSIHCSVIANLT